MKNNGLFSSIFIEDLKERVALDDAAQGRMATLAQTWRTRNTQDTESLWESFLKQALSYLEFVPPGNPTAPGVYPLYEDYNFSKCISVLYLAPPGSDIDNTSVGSFYPAKLLAQLKERKLSWGILTDGASWRLHSTKSSRPYEDYVELPLEQALEGSDEAEYGLFERFFHKDSFIAEETEGTESGQQDESAGIYKCRLDRDRDQSEKVLDEEVKAPFLAQVDEVLQYICNGFIFDTQKSGEEYAEEERREIFESAVKLIYRCLFLFYAEARRLLPSDPDKADLKKSGSWGNINCATIFSPGRCTCWRLWSLTTTNRTKNTPYRTKTWRFAISGSFTRTSWNTRFSLPTQTASVAVPRKAWKCCWPPRQRKRRVTR
jgi:hypothetical protein